MVDGETEKSGMTVKMKATDYILRQCIDSRATHEAIRHVVRGQGNRVSDFYGAFCDSALSQLLMLDQDGDLIWTENWVPPGRFVTPADIGVESGGWMSNPGEQPVPDGTPIEVEHEDGERFATVAGGRYNKHWGADAGKGTIVRWRFRFDETGETMTDGQEYTPAQMLHMVADAMERGDEPADCFEPTEPLHINCWTDAAALAANDRLRLRPRTIRIGDVDVPEPLREAPPMGTEYYVPDPGEVDLTCAYTWNKDPVDRSFLFSNMCHRTHESARQHARALIIASGGEVR